MKNLRLSALALAVWLAYPSTGVAAMMASQAASIPAATMVNQYVTVTFKVTNTGATSIVIYSLTFQGPNNGNWNGGGDQRGGQLLAPGESHTYAAYVLANEAGSYTFSWSASASEYGTSVTGSTTANVTVTVADPVAALKYGKPVPLGKMEIRNAIIRSTRGMTEAGQPQVALIVVHGAPNGRVRLSVVAPSGYGLGAIQTMTTPMQMNSSDEIVLDGEGMGAASFDGTAGNGGVLQPGVYWILASGAVNDRKPVLVLTKTQ